MCSLSHSMATFKIHEDENNLPTAHLSAKLKELGPIQTKRVALGEIKTNGNGGVGKFGGLKEPKSGQSEISAKESGKTAQTGRSVLGDVKNLVNISSKLEVPPKDPVLAKKDDTKSVSAQDEYTKQTSDRVEKPHRSPLKEIALNKNDEVPRLSPMLIDDSPIVKAQLPKSIKLQLEDLYTCVTYKDDIFQYLKQREMQFMPKPYYMKRQPDVSYSMRTILVDWLVEVGEEYKLNPSTLFLTVCYVDRFLSQMAVVRGKLQLLGTAAMFLASKFEEIYPPEVGEFTYITDDSYTKQQVLKMENMIIKVLDYNLSVPTSYTFIMHIAAAVRMPEKVMTMAIFLCELSLLEADPYLAHPPSLVASGAIALAYHCLDYVDVWPHFLQQTTGYPLKQLANVVNCLNDTHEKSFKASQQAIRDKYNCVKFLFVSKVPHRRLSIRVD